LGECAVLVIDVDLNALRAAETAPARNRAHEVRLQITTNPKSLIPNHFRGSALCCAPWLM
jgi:hypothetical protein